MLCGTGAFDEVLRRTHTNMKTPICIVAMKLIGIVLLSASLGCCFGQTDTNLLASGHWSEAVQDSEGYALRGRLLAHPARCDQRFFLVRLVYSTARPSECSQVSRLARNIEITQGKNTC